jgi:hypothetical protein
MIFRNIQLVPDVKDNDVVNIISRREMLQADRKEKMHSKEHGRSSKPKHYHDNDYSSPSKQKTQQ